MKRMTGLAVAVALAACMPAESSETQFEYQPYGRWSYRGDFCFRLQSGACTDAALVEDSRDRRGLRRDTAYFMAYQVAAIAILYIAPESVSGWTDEQKSEYSLSIWWDNVRNPAWDSDEFYINYILHPYWGAAYFVRARERGYANSGAFWYSALLSALYEFGAEALFEQPSIQDLIVTPVFGSLLGMYFVELRDEAREREVEFGYRKTGDKWLMVLTDPLGSLNRQFDRWFGWEESNIQLQPYDRSTLLNSRSPGGMPPDEEIGIRFSIRWR